MSIFIREDGRDFVLENQDGWTMEPRGIVLSWRQVVALKRAIDVTTFSSHGDLELEPEDG